MKKSARTYTPEQLKDIRAFMDECAAEIVNPTPRVIGGNHKTGTIPVFNMPALMTCPNCKHCAGSCYALRDYAMKRKNVVKSHLNNYFSWLKNPDDVKGK